MPAFIALLRGVNLGGHNMMKMEALRSALRIAQPARRADLHPKRQHRLPHKRAPTRRSLRRRSRSAIEAQFGFRPPVILRTTSEWKAAIARNPFAGPPEVEPGKLLVYFLRAIRAMSPGNGRAPYRPRRKSFTSSSRELYIYFPNGHGQAQAFDAGGRARAQGFGQRQKLEYRAQAAGNGRASGSAE